MHIYHSLNFAKIPRLTRPFFTFTGWLEAGASTASNYNCKSKYDGVEAADIKRIKDLEDENHRLK